ncbi:MAG: SDR family oxidoreductase [Pseudomonadota bacterium]
MMRAKTGRVIFLSSVVGEMGNAGQTAYSASKAALLGVTKSLAREYASRGITVKCGHPGFHRHGYDQRPDRRAKDRHADCCPARSDGTAREIAAAIAYLASDEAGYITGQALRVNGGMYM